MVGSRVNLVNRRGEVVEIWIEDPSARIVVDENLGTGRGKGVWAIAEGSRDALLADEAKPLRCDRKPHACAAMVEVVGRVEVEKARTVLNAEEEDVAMDEEGEATAA